MMGTWLGAVNAGVHDAECDIQRCARQRNHAGLRGRHSCRAGWQPPQCCVRQKNPDTAKMQLAQASLAAQVRQLQMQLLFEVAQIFGRAPVVAGNHLVAGAVVADRGAKRQVHIKRQRAHEAADVAS